MKFTKKLGSLGVLFCCGIISLTAQQLPNSGFENWKGDGKCGNSIQVNSATKYDERQRPGDEPIDWNGSSVNQKVSIATKKETLITKNASGRNGNSVVMTNKYVGALGIGANAPGYITFGTPWVYAVMSISKCDGGTYGGTEFTYRPDAITGWYKRSYEEAEDARIIVYLWEGTYKSTVSEKNMSLDNLDRAIMGREGTTVTQEGTRIAYCDYAITGTLSDWTEITVPLTYDVTNVTPTMMNVIISSADYWNRDNMNDNSVLEADDVKFLYYSRLNSLSINGKPIEGFNKDVYEYTLNEMMPANLSTSNIVAEVMGMDATASTVIQAVSKKIIITVTNKSGNDVDGMKTHTYTIAYNEPATVTGVTPADGDVDVALDTEVKLTVSKALENAIVTVNNGTTNVDANYNAETGVISFTKEYETTYTITVSADNMTDTYSWSFTTVAPSYPTDYYNGDLDIDISGLASLGMDMEASHVYSCSMIEIARKTEESCNFYLRDFAFGGMILGDIIVPDVTITNNNGTLTYNGTVANLIVGGFIDCDVNVRGTETADGKASMEIDVIWFADRASNLTAPIYVTFDGQMVVDGLRLLSLTVEGETIELTEDMMFNFAATEILVEGSIPAIGYSKKDLTSQVSVEVCEHAIKIWVEKDGKSNFYSLYDEDATYTGVTLPETIENNLYINATREIAGVTMVNGKIVYNMPFIEGVDWHAVGLPFAGGTREAYDENDDNIDLALNTEVALYNKGTEFKYDYTAEAQTALWHRTNGSYASGIIFSSEAGWGAGTTNANLEAQYVMLTNPGLTTVEASTLISDATAYYVVDETGKNFVKVATADVAPFTSVLAYRGTDVPVESFAINVTSGIEDITTQTAGVYAAEGNIYIKGYNGTATIYAINGVLVETIEIDNNATIAMEQGAYIVRTGSSCTMVIVR